MAASESITCANATRQRRTSSSSVDQATLLCAADSANSCSKQLACQKKAQHKDYPWTPGFFVRLPFFGLGALFGFTVLSAAAAIVLGASNGVPIDEWNIAGIKLQPQVWVAALSTISNALLGYSFIEGIAVAFWCRACAGTSLQVLHDYYESQSVIAATWLLCCRRRNIVAFSCFFVTASMIRGPLFQRASTVTSQVQTTPGSMRLEVATPVPEWYFLPESQVRKLGLYTAWTLSAEARAVMHNLTLERPIPVNETGCRGECASTVQAPGFRIDCTMSSEPYNLDPPAVALPPSEDDNSRNSTSSRGGSRPNPTTLSARVFGIGFAEAWQVGKRAEINITTAFKNESACAGRIYAHRCTLRPGVVEYDVVLRARSIELRSRDSHHSGDDAWRHDRLVSPSWTENWPTYPWTMALQSLHPPFRVNMTSVRAAGGLRDGDGGSSVMALERFEHCPSSSARYDSRSNTSCLLGKGGHLRDVSVAYLERGQRATSLCNVTYRDPMPNILKSMRQLGLRAAIDAAAYANRSDLFAASVDYAPIAAGWAQTLRFRNSAARTVFRTDAAFVLAALAASAVGALAVAPLYRGWWQLGRAVSLNPLETAKAFGAPLLGAANSNAGRAQLAAVVGRERVRYGAVSVDWEDSGGGGGGGGVDSCGGGPADGASDTEGPDSNPMRRRCLRMCVDDEGARIERPRDGASYV